jgi:hypothetical protein
MLLQGTHTMIDEALSTDFLVIQHAPADPVELWLDWEPAVDGDPELRLQAWRDGDDLLVHAQDESSQRPVRRLTDLDFEVWRGLDRDGVWVLCGPSGVLSRRPFSVSSAPAEKGDTED